MASLWLVDPTTLKPPPGGKRKIRHAPLIDLAGLQAAISTGALKNDDVWLATQRCNHHVQDLQWTMQDILDCVGCLQSGDHRDAEWCEDGKDRWLACDAYAICYDEARSCRSREGLEFYLKFSINENDPLTLMMVSVHLSQ